MAFLDILKGRKREEVKPRRLPRGAFSLKANQLLAEKRAEKPAKNLPETKTKEKSAAKQLPASKAPASKSALAARILVRPHATEKATTLAEQNIYTFRVFPKANKILVKRMIKEMYGFEPVKIRITKVLPKKILSKGKIGIKPGFKKALVYLKKSDKIELV